MTTTQMIKEHFTRFSSTFKGTLTEQEIMERIAVYFRLPVSDVETRIKKETYGFINMRAQPVHWGHQHIINEIMLDGRIPVIILGDDSDANLERNPLSVNQRKELIRLIFNNTNIIITSVKDNTDWTKWYMSVIHELEKISDVSDFVMYYNNKEQDRYKEFTCMNKTYKDDFYTSIFKTEGIKHKSIEFAERTDITIDANATDIRKDFEDFKHLLDARVYMKLREWGW